MLSNFNENTKIQPKTITNVFDEENRIEKREEEILEHKRRKRVKTGLPPTSKRILLIWLFYNVENPYPTKEEKEELCQRANITMAQINNFFINSRRRILKPLLGDYHTKELAHQIKTRKRKKVPMDQIDFETSPVLSNN
ncbi:hypothetical protein M0811_13086 [Anaeramoeba ignava]|uniref:Homeobox domain-containing protein n=1 Tax=Anaeramoeba ignava TaxID=1746090 RepID=A0A9Q0L758_ANAIG|nr:hypothetical protein M0811_13086 [Anaeramoeba ignava]